MNDKKFASYHEGLIERLKDENYFHLFIKELQTDYTNALIDDIQSLDQKLAIAVGAIENLYEGLEGLVGQDFHESDLAKTSREALAKIRSVE